MSDKFFRIELSHLFNLIESEYTLQKSIFGIPEPLFFKPRVKDPFKIKRYGKLLETPIGVAAGPHTQLAQNIISAWLCGARYIELKTVQTLDELEISKPCIDMRDEGYNCEWSQELKIEDAIDEYVNAWVLIHVLHLKLGFKGAPGIIFNMSVGYDLQGILKENVQHFFRTMNDASAMIEKKKTELESQYPRIGKLYIPALISDNVTLSTMHGCPPEEIENIGTFLIAEKKLHTTIKLNPTLPGPDLLRSIINDTLGFETRVPDEAFTHDLKYPEAVSIIRNLTSAAENNHVHFGLKLTNTLECINDRHALPEDQKMIYMSGRALHPLSIHLARKLQHDFNGKLDISFSGGADCFNITDVIACGLSPVTVCSDLLKPGGYGRLAQYITSISKAFRKTKSTSVDEFILYTASEDDLAKARLKNISAYAPQTLQKKEYRKDPWQKPDIKTRRQLGPFDCIAAPCVDTCPSNQEIPQYIYHASHNEPDKAMQVILRTNPFPNVCGMVCDHVCQTKCTRVNYDDPLMIRELKRYIAENARKAGTIAIPENKGSSVAVIGAGPSGLACAYFLRLAGFAVTVFESGDHAGGLVSSAIPEFRLSGEALQKDIEMICSLGVVIENNSKIDPERFRKLQQEFKFIYIAVGAQEAVRLFISGEEFPGISDPLRFLSDVRSHKIKSMSGSIAVIGGGNTALDVARTCRRLVGKKGDVTILYRRTLKEMPAEPGEIRSAMNEGIKLNELVSPTKIEKNESGRFNLHCQKMRLGEKDIKGRPRPVPVDHSDFVMQFDMIIPALGQQSVIDFVDTDFKVDPETFETSIPDVFMGGDAYRGGSTIIQSIGDGRRAAIAIMANEQITSGPGALQKKEVTIQELMVRRSQREHGQEIPERKISPGNPFTLVSRTLKQKEAEQEAARCLYCDELCNICVTVCPNRANIYFEIEPLSVPVFRIRRNENGKTDIVSSGSKMITQKVQVANLANFCNECGNCTTFCPTSGRPFADKPRIHLTIASFKNDDDGYFLSVLPTKTILIHKKKGSVATLEKLMDRWIYEDEDLSFVMNDINFEIADVRYFIEKPDDYITQRAAEMMFLYKGLKAKFT